jgi:MFS family permease
MSQPSPSPAATAAVRVTLLLTSTLTVMAGATIAPSLPALQAHFADVPNVDYLARFVLTLPALFVASCSPLAGYIIDRFGRRRLLIASVTLYGIAGTAGAIVDWLPAILLSRALLGVAVAGTLTATTTLIGDYFAGADRSRMMAWRTTAVNGGGVLFMALGGVLASLNWRGPFFVYLLALVLLPLVLRFLHEPPRVTRAQAAAARAAGAVLPPVPWLLIGMLGLLTFFYSWIFYVIPTQLPFLLREIGIGDPGLAGLAMASVLIGTSGMSLFYPRLQARLGQPLLFLLGFGIKAAGYAAIGLTESLPLVFAGAVVAGLGLGIVMPALAVTLLNAAPEHVRGRVMGGNSTATMLGHFTSPLLSQPIVAAFGLPAAFQASAAILAVIAVLTPAVLLLRRRAARPLPAE